MKDPRYIGIGLGLVIGALYLVFIAQSPIWSIVLATTITILGFMFFFQVQGTWKNRRNQ